MKKSKKYNYLKVLQKHTPTGWQDADKYPCNSYGIMEQKEKFQLEIFEKRLKVLGHQTRAIFRKELIKETV